MPNTGFWSYVHADDEAERGRIRQLAQDLTRQYEAITNDSIDLFLDKSSLDWGDDWESRIDSSIMVTAFFVPIVSPRYLASEACRRELQLFTRKADRLGIRELVLPVVWFDVPELSEPEPTDDLVVLIKRYQWEDWRELRFEDRDSAAYRRAVAALAKRLVEGSSRAGAELPVSAVDEAAAVIGVEEDDSPGTLDILASAMNALPAWTETVQAVGTEIQAVSALAEETTSKMQEADRRSGGNFAARLVVARQFGQSLEPRAQHIEELSNDFTTHLYNVNDGIRAIVSQVEIEASNDEDREAVCRFFESIRTMAGSSRTGLAGLKSMVDSIAPVEKMSRDMRPPLRRMRKALTVMVEGQVVIDDWVRLIDESAIDCSRCSGVT